MKSLLFFLVLILSAGNTVADSSEDFRLEGVMYEMNNPKESTAIVNGQFLKQGDSYQNHDVEEVGSDYVILTPQDGGEKIRLNVMDSHKKPEAEGTTDKKSEGKADPQSSPAPAQQAGGLSFNFGNILNLTAEVKAQAELKQIFMGCSIAESYDRADFAENPGQPRFTLEKLVERQLIPKTFANPQSGPYTYSILDTEDHGFEVHGDPTNPKSSLKHFMIDQDGIWYVERGKPATNKSPTLR